MINIQKEIVESIEETASNACSYQPQTMRLIDSAAALETFYLNRFYEQSVYLL